MYLGEAEMLSLLFSTRVFWSVGATKEFQSIWDGPARIVLLNAALLHSGLSFFAANVRSSWMRQEASIYSVCRVKRPHIFIFFWKKETSRWIAGHFESDMTTDVWWEPFTRKQPSECDRVSISPKTFKAKWVNSRWQLTKNSISKKQKKKRSYSANKPYGQTETVRCWCADGPSVLLSFDMYRCAARLLWESISFLRRHSPHDRYMWQVRLNSSNNAKQALRMSCIREEWETGVRFVLYYSAAVCI